MSTSYLFAALLTLAMVRVTLLPLAAQPRASSFSAFPILNYGSDTGFGFGGKGLLKNRLRHEESFDFILFASTKGEQWYAFSFALPDPEIRQGRRYVVAYDVKLEYDKMLRSNFFGIGNNSRDNAWQFPKEFFKIECAASHAFSARLIGELSYRFVHYSVYGFDPNWGNLTSATPGTGEHNVSGISLRLRWDTRDSSIHPRRGWRAFFSTEFASRVLGSTWDFKKYRLEASTYFAFRRHHILAARVWAQHLTGAAPYVELSKIGDSWTARGYKADRFLDAAATLTSFEYRYPIFRKLGGVLFVDAGHVWPTLVKLSFDNWHANWGVGARYYLANFVVRFDAGFSTEGTRLFFQFGHVF